MAGRYDVVIQRLEKIIEHWFDKEMLNTVLRFKNEGLCPNLLWDQFKLSEKEFYPCFREYNEKFNKENSNSLMFPVECSFKGYGKSWVEQRHYNNPKRLHLAVFLLSWLRQHNI